jgi:endonuclease/exonuclease/phosphatase family metal-dependent hydrolase
LECARVKKVGVLAVVLLTGLVSVTVSRPLPAAVTEEIGEAPVLPHEGLSVMTYNVKGLPFPAALGRASAMSEIGQRLRALRQRGRQPDVIALQEAFIPEAKAIARQAGYRYVATGPDASDVRALAKQATGQPAYAPLAHPSWIKGETEGKWIDSGLVIMSDYPIVASRKMAYPGQVCAGYDCLAAKGVLLAWIRLPGHAQPIAIADTHLNSRSASGVSVEKANAAYRLQLNLARAFLRSHVSSRTSLIFAGDFNVGHDPDRIAAANALVGRSAGAAEASAQGIAGAPIASPDLAAVARRAKDKQYFRAGTGETLTMKTLEVPFGLENGGSALSDHLGYVARYRMD